GDGLGGPGLGGPGLDRDAAGDEAAERDAGHDEPRASGGLWRRLRRRQLSPPQDVRSAARRRAVPRRLGLVVDSCAAVAVIAVLVSSGLGLLLGSGSGVDPAGAEGVGLTAEQHETAEQHDGSAAAPQSGEEAESTSPEAASDTGG